MAGGAAAATKAPRLQKGDDGLVRAISHAGPRPLPYSPSFLLPSRVNAIGAAERLRYVRTHSSETRYIRLNREACTLRTRVTRTRTPKAGPCREDGGSGEARFVGAVLPDVNEGSSSSGRTAYVVCVLQRICDVCCRIDVNAGAARSAQRLNRAPASAA